MVGGPASGIHREGAMTARSSSLGAYAVLAVSLGLAAVFVYAGVQKMGDSLQFADSIEGFAILPAALISPFALALPPFEIACGLLLLWPPTRRVGALGIALLSVMFFAALSSALLRGLTLDCGCFGIGAPSRARMWVELGLNVALFGGAAFIYLRSIVRPASRSASPIA
jgi:putative oxidoreductase